MDNRKGLAIVVLVPLVALGIAAPSCAEPQTDQGAGEIDCTQERQAEVATPPERRLVQVGRNVSLSSPQGADLRGGVWSPQGDAVAFVAPTNETEPLDAAPPAAGEQAATEAARPVAVSRNRIWLYDIEAGEWRKVADDGAQPRFSTDGSRLFLMQGTRLMTFHRASGNVTPAGPQTAATPEGRLLARPLGDGGLLAPPAAGGRVQEIGRAQSRWPALDLSVSDRLSVSPDDAFLLVDQRGRGDQPPRLEVFGPGGERRALLRNCPYAGTQAGWSARGHALAYPLPVPRPEIHWVDPATGERRVVVRFEEPDRLSGVTVSPDARFVAFARGDRGATPRIGVVAADGSGLQWVAEGILPSWSPGGDRLLYAVPGEGGALGWRIVELTVPETAGTQGGGA